MSPYFREMGDNKLQKVAKEYKCLCCDYITSRKSSYDKHILTAKHLMVTNGNKTVANNNNSYICSCGKEFKYRQGLSRHKKNCSGIRTNIVNETTTPVPVSNINSSINNDAVSAILQDNAEMRKMLVQQQEHMRQQQEHIRQQQEQHNKQQEEHNKQIQDLIPQLQQVTNINNNNCNNTTNNKFNLNFFLNEQCKDAISIQNFIENLNIGIPELEHMGDVGYVKGMMSIFSNTLGAMDIYKRPLHCTDLKRETVYIKQGDTWKKDTDDKTELKKLIKTVEYKNYGSLRLWEREHPEAFECDTQDNIDYMRISNESLGGFDSTDAIKLGKIMKHVVREVYIK